MLERQIYASCLMHACAACKNPAENTSKKRMEKKATNKGNKNKNTIEQTSKRKRNKEKEKKKEKEYHSSDKVHKLALGSLHDRGCSE